MPAAGAIDGFLVVTWYDHAQDSWRMRFGQCQPVAHVTGEFLNRLTVDPPAGVYLRETPDASVIVADTYRGKVVYRVEDYDFERDAYRLRWPD